jgi:ketosteroid isomerase-like protein
LQKWPVALATVKTMKIPSLLVVAGFAIGLALPTFAQQKDTVDPKIIEQLREEDKNFEEEYNKHDATVVTTLYTEEAVFETPNGTFNGREAIEGLYQKVYFERNHSKDHITTVGEITEAGDETRAIGVWSDTFEEIGTIHANGTYLWVLVHDGDSWKISKSRFEITNEEH